MKDECREMFNRTCPISGCVDLPCARFEDDDESRWAGDIAMWKESEREEKLATQAAHDALDERLEKLEAIVRRIRT